MFSLDFSSPIFTASLAVLKKPELYGQLTLLGISFFLGFINLKVVKKKWAALPNKMAFLKKTVDTFSLFIIFSLVSLAAFLPLYYQFFSEDLKVVKIVSTLAITLFFIRLVQKKMPPLWALPFTYIATAISLLTITGLISPLTRLLNHTQLKMGFLETSLLKLIQSSALIAFLSWLALFVSKRIENKLSKQVAINKSTQILISKFARVVLVACSLFLSLSLVGIDLSVLSFFAGAIGVAVGFGLQNILSNLFCGIIILMDRSIRPGDVISLTDIGTCGIVHKLNARYISIRTREGIEHLIPNENFVNKKTENWTHSDPFIRVTTSFEVDIQSDIELVEKLLIEIAQKTPRVISKPEPAIRIVSVSQNCMEIKLRVWIADPENGFSGIRHHIYKEALLAFKEHHVQIPRKPMDIYLKQNELSALLEKQKTLA